jgi:Na+/proline symporter
VAAVFLPRYFQGNLYTAYEVLEKRFGSLTRRVSSLLFLTTRSLGDGLRLFLAGLVLERLLGWPLAASVLVMSVVTVIYTVIGGLRSVCDHRSHRWWLAAPAHLGCRFRQTAAL